MHSTFGHHLLLKTVSLPPGEEWEPRFQGWTFFLLTEGVSYWMQPNKHHELSAGSAIITSHRVQGLVRASQIGEVRVDYFTVEPQRLTGVVTLSEQESLENAAGREEISFRVFAPSDPVSETFRSLVPERAGYRLRLRLQLLELFVRALGNNLVCPDSIPALELSAHARLERFLKGRPATDLLDLRFSDLVRGTRCAPRHLSRIFSETMGMSFRQKQAEIRLGRAQELLATSRSRVYQVAMASGYQSISVFNVMFKRRFGVTPAKWRQQLREGQAPPPPGTRPGQEQA